MLDEIKNIQYMQGTHKPSKNYLSLNYNWDLVQYGRRLKDTNDDDKINIDCNNNNKKLGKNPHVPK